MGGPSKNMPLAHWRLSEPLPVLANSRNDVFLQIGCDEYLNFLSSSQVARPFCDDDYCDSSFKNFFEKIETCHYHGVDYDFNRIPNSQLLMMHVNTRSLQKEKKFDSFLQTPSSLPICLFSLLCVIVFYV